jgi:hypothetical protein
VKVKIYPAASWFREGRPVQDQTGQLQGGGFMGYAIGKICPIPAR